MPAIKHALITIYVMAADGHVVMRRVNYGYLISEYHAPEMS